MKWSPVSFNTSAHSLCRLFKINYIKLEQAKARFANIAEILRFCIIGQHLVCRKLSKDDNLNGPQGTNLQKSPRKACSVPQDPQSVNCIPKHDINIHINISGIRTTLHAPRLVALLCSAIILLSE